MKHTFFFILFWSLAHVLCAQAERNYKNELAVNSLVLLNKDISQPSVLYRHYWGNHALRASSTYQTWQTQIHQNPIQSIAVQDTQIALTGTYSNSAAFTLGLGYEWHGKKMLENKPHVYVGIELAVGSGQIQVNNATYYYKLKDGVYENQGGQGYVLHNIKPVRNSLLFQAGARSAFGVQVPFGKRFFSAFELLALSSIQTDNDRVSQQRVSQFNFDTKINVWLGMRF